MYETIALNSNTIIVKSNNKEELSDIMYGCIFISMMMMRNIKLV
jgi:hypothetical protein